MVERRIAAAAIAVLAVAVVVLSVVVAADHGSTTKVVAVSTPTKPAPPGKRFLYSQDAHAGTLVPTGKPNEYRLTLTGVHPSALYFLDRPAAEVGVMTVDELFAALFGKQGEAPPNAAVNALVPQRGNRQYTMGVTLLRAKYDRAHQTVRYLVRALPQGPSARQEHGRTDVVLPRTFSHTSLFIDDGGNTCRGDIYNYTNIALQRSDEGKWSSDDWATFPDASIAGTPGDPSASTYESDGGFDRGCHNWVTYAYAGGTIELSLSDPHSGSNSYQCDNNETDSDYQIKCGYYGFSTTGGDSLDLMWVICSNNPAYQATVSPGDGKTYGGCDWMTDNSGGSGGVTWLD